MSDVLTAANARKTTLVPVTTMEEVPVLDAQEKAELVASIKDAEADIASGRSVVFEKPGAFRSFLDKGMKAAQSQNLIGSAPGGLCGKLSLPQSQQEKNRTNNSSNKLPSCDLALIICGSRAE